MSSENAIVPALSPHEQMRRAVARNSGSLPDNEVNLRELTGRWLRVIGMYGPKDLGNGPVYALDLVDATGTRYTSYCGSKQVIEQLATPGLADYSFDPANQFLIYFTWTDRFNSKGDETGYFTARLHFSAADDTVRPMLDTVAES